DICRATGDVLFASRLDRSQWSQRFYAQGFYVDVEFDPGFISPRALRLRKALAGLALNSGNEEVRRLQKETDDLYLALDERDRVIGELNADLNSVRSTVTWRVLERLPTMRETILRRPVLRPIYWILRRSAEVMLDEGPRGVAQRIGVKLRLALRGQYFLVKPRRPVDFNTQYN